VVSWFVLQRLYSGQEARVQLDVIRTAGTLVIGNGHTVGRVAFQLVQLGSDLVETVAVDGLALALAGGCEDVSTTYPSTV
jgi:hypothetical protein